MNSLDKIKVSIFVIFYGWVQADPTTVMKFQNENSNEWLNFVSFFNMRAVLINSSSIFFTLIYKKDLDCDNHLYFYVCIEKRRHLFFITFVYNYSFYNPYRNIFCLSSVLISCLNLGVVIRTTSNKSKGFFIYMNIIIFC